MVSATSDAFIVAGLPESGMVSDRQLGAGLVVLALACAAGGVWLFDHHHETLAGLAGLVGVVVGGLGAAVGSGRGFDHGEGGDNRFVGVLVVFGTVAGFGLVVAVLMLLVESAVYG